MFISRTIIIIIIITILYFIIVSLSDFDVPGTIITSASVTSTTSLLHTAAIQSYSDGGSNNKIYHLVKPDTGEGESKIVSEVFLTRLLSTKV